MIHSACTIPTAAAAPVRRAALLLVAVLALVGTVRAGDAAREVSEFDLKAAAVYHIVPFIEWPPAVFPDAEAPLIVGILGRGPVANLLDDIALNEKWRGRRVVVEHYTTPAEAQRCHVLFVARSMQPRWPHLRSYFARRPTLTISDAPGFAEHGGIVQLAIERNKLRLIVNLDAARSAQINISSKVLRLAHVLGQEK